MKLLAPLVAALLFAAQLTAAQLTVAQSEPLHLVPSERVEYSGEAVTINGDLLADTFIPGLGWLSGSSTPAPVLAQERLYLDDVNRVRLGIAPHPVEAPGAAPAVDEWANELSTQVRFGGDSQVRVVVDLPQLLDAKLLESLERQGRLQEDEALVLQLPRLPLPPEQPDPYRGFDVSLYPTTGGISFELRGPASSYRVFTLESPTRLVVDVVPLQQEPIDRKLEVLHPGVTYRTFGATTPIGESLVHLLEFAPGSGEFRVVGTSEVPRTLSELADGAFAAINAGYFDTRTFQAIGLLRVDYGLQSLPSRNRASVGFGIAGPVIDRVRARIDVRVNGALYRREAPAQSDEGVQVNTVAGAVAGSARKGALVVQHGRIVANRVGPVRVPGNGFVVVYPPEDRELALIDPGALVSIDVDFEPDDFQVVRYAVEAGPLLVENGIPAFQPGLEQFSSGERILDAYTQQSAIGIRPDGTVLFLVANSMRAQDLVPLFLSLDASHAMRLDSGSSSTLLADGRVLNRVGERRIVSAIIYLPDGT